MKAVSYLRRSTDKQTDLSFERQELIINGFCEREGITILDSYIETASGACDDRQQLKACIEYATRTKTPIVVASISRLSRSVAFGSQLLQNENLTFYICDLGMKADRFMMNVLLCVAQKERDMISTRTATALQALKAQGAQLGNPNWDIALDKARSVRKSKAQARQVKYLEAIEMIRSTGITSYNGIARKMNDLGMTSPKGRSISPNYIRNLILSPA
jgi:DNA invertase Pin-like site-specific DNA recombinase